MSPFETVYGFHEVAVNRFENGKGDGVWKDGLISSSKPFTSALTISMVTVTFFGKSDVGRKRDKNEDAYIVDPDIGFALVADGMGGAAAGEVASRIFTQTSSEVFAGYAGARTDETVVELVQKSFSLANRRILDHVKENVHHAGMGCTAEILAFSDRSFIVGHVGDSRSYRFRNGALKQLTKDHSLVEDQVEQGLITKDEARNHRLRNVLLRAVGVNEELALDIVSGSFYAGDIFLLCSDGLTDMIDDERLVEILSSNDSGDVKSDELIAAANEAGGKDNITVVLAQVL